MLSVLFCTRDRAESLPQTLSAFATLRPPRGGWRLLVVDNGSRDETIPVLRAFADRLPLTVLTEPVAGKNRAMNRAVEQVEGDLAVLTDDDVLPEPLWLVRLRIAADRHPEAALFGGTILPEWPAPLPDWLTEETVDFGVLYAKLIRPDGPCRHVHVWGPNMAVRTSVFAAGHRFDTGVGPDGAASAYAMGGETEFNARLAAAGYAAHFVADAVVRHLIRPEQLTWRWILDRAYRHGLGVMRYDGPAFAKGPPFLAGLPKGLLKRRLLYAVSAPVVGTLPPSAGRLRHLFRARWVAGIADAMRQQRRMADAGPQPATGLTSFANAAHGVPGSGRRRVHHG